MLENKEPMATVATRDLAVAKKFYQETLGLTLAAETPEVLTFGKGQFKLLVYRSQYAGTNQATVVTWGVGAEAEAIVGDLKRRGVVFEHYDMPGISLEGDLHVGYGGKVAWFKDPDGNILSVNGM